MSDVWLQRSEPTANDVMLGRMFLNEERLQLKDDMRLAAEDPGLLLCVHVFSLLSALYSLIYVYMSLVCYRPCTVSYMCICL